MSVRNIDSGREVGGLLQASLADMKKTPRENRSHWYGQAEAELISGPTVCRFPLEEIKHVSYGELQDAEFFPLALKKSPLVGFVANVTPIHLISAS